jgi:hypothetical protein
LALTSGDNTDFSGLDFNSTSLLDLADEMAKRKVDIGFPVKTTIRSVLRRKRNKQTDKKC